MLFDARRLSRRSLILGVAGAAMGIGASGCSVGGSVSPTIPTMTAPVTPTPFPSPADQVRLATAAARNGIAFGTSAATWQLADVDHSRLVDSQSGVVLTEDDLLWYRLRPSPKAALDFGYADAFFRRADKHRQRVVGAHLVWDEGFGEGWTTEALNGLSRRRAHALLFGTLEETVKRYRNRASGWIVANEVTGPDGHHGLRTDVPWYNTIGAGYVAEAFNRARSQNDQAVLILNEYGFETVDADGNDPIERQQAFLQVLDSLLSHSVPVDAVGIQAHLLAEDFADRFDANQYRTFLSSLADRGVEILITELDVQDDGLPADVAQRDRAIAAVYGRYLDVALQEDAVKAVIAFGLSDRYTWLEEDFPRADGIRRRPLVYDSSLRAKAAREAVQLSLTRAKQRAPLWS